MRLTRTYIDTALSVGTSVSLPENASVHLLRVLRLGLGDACIVFNGDGCDYAARLISLGKRAAQVEVIGRRELNNETPLRITLAQALTRGEKMDWVLQKATELGVATLAPVITERCEVKLDAERSEKRLQHWRGVIVSACEQCGRARLPALAPPLPLRDWLATQAAPGWYLDPEADRGLQHLPSIEAVSLVVGPEGGLSERDQLQLRAADFRGLRLGPRILRTETAGLAALAAIQALHGDLDIR